MIDDLSVGRRGALPGDVAFVRAVAGDGPAMHAVTNEHRIGAVMHLAARVGVAESISEPGAFHCVNAAAMSSLAPPGRRAR